MTIRHSLPDTTENRIAIVKRKYPEAVCLRGGPRKQWWNGKTTEAYWWYVYENPESSLKIGLGGSERGAWGNASRAVMQWTKTA